MTILIKLKVTITKMIKNSNNYNFINGEINLNVMILLLILQFNKFFIAIGFDDIQKELFLNGTQFI